MCKEHFNAHKSVAICLRNIAFSREKNCIFTMWILHPPKLADLIKQLYALGIATVKHTQTNIFWEKNMGFLAIKERCNIECYHFRASHKYGFPHQNQRKKRKNFGYVHIYTSCVPYIELKHETVFDQDLYAKSRLIYKILATHLKWVVNAKHLNLKDVNRKSSIKT